MNWGKWIIVSFVLFAVFIGILVVICVRQDISLVSKNYYQEELAYQQQIDRMNNTARLEEKPVIAFTGQALEIQFSQFNNLEGGEVKVFRPSDPRFDKQFILHTSTETIQRFDIRSFPKGMYRVKMRWSMKGKEYYVEQVIIL